VSLTLHTVFTFTAVDGGYSDKVDLGPDPFINITESMAYFRCRKCRWVIIAHCKYCLTIILYNRRLLFTDDSTLPHNVGKGEAAFKWHKRSKPVSNGASPNQATNEQGPPHEDRCSSWFIEPVEWMESFLIGHVEGKVLTVYKSKLLC